ncbi:PHD finger protein 7-like [Corvus moneduloides]|uniref:PHD finger protein 7-like n=1 Tax=Corvus moneduloides TaxID=1196302 RepID=UPI001363EDEF|nr:PHD finger protein 7-like [Corvus moneduloides]
MADRKQEAPDAREPACLLCRRAEADPDICGDKREKHGLRAHVFCLYFASLLSQKDDNRTGLMGFRPRDIQLAVSRAAQKHCCVCGETGATIMCCQEDCDRWFHLPCAKHGACVTQYIAQYSAYCPEHRPHLELGVTPEPETECAICMETVDDRETYGTMVCPACKRAWFHRDCIQGQALRAGLLCLHCPLCRDIRAFLPRMFIMGIRIPFRLPTWEDNDSFAELGERHSRCNARECHYPGGREEAEEEGPWELLLCSSCAAEGSHRRCSGLRNSTASWECDSCAGLGTASSHEAEFNGPSLTSQSELEPAHGSAESEAISHSSGSPVPSGLSPPSPSRESRKRSSTNHAALEPLLESSSLESSSPGTESEATSGSSDSSSPDPEDGSRPKSPGPDHRQSRSCQQHWALNRTVRSRIRRDRSRRTGPRAERPRCRGTPSETSPRRNRSRQQGPAPNPPVRSRIRRDRSRRTGPRAERPRCRGTPSETSPRCNRSRQQGPAPNPPVRSRIRRDRSRRTGPGAEMPRCRETSSGTSPRRSRSRQQGPAPNPPVRSRNRRDGGRRTAASAERPRRRETSSGTSTRSNRSRQRRRASTQTSKSSM